LRVIAWVRFFSLVFNDVSQVFCSSEVFQTHCWCRRHNSGFSGFRVDAPIMPSVLRRIAPPRARKYNIPVTEGSGGSHLSVSTHTVGPKKKNRGVANWCRNRNLSSGLTVRAVRSVAYTPAHTLHLQTPSFYFCLLSPPPPRKAVSPAYCPQCPPIAFTWCHGSSNLFS